MKKLTGDGKTNTRTVKNTQGERVVSDEDTKYDEEQDRTELEVIC